MVGWFMVFNATSNNISVVSCYYFYGGHLGCDRLVVGLTTTFVPVQSVPMTTKVVSSNPVHGEVYKIQHYVIKFVSDTHISWKGYLIGSLNPKINIHLMAYKKTQTVRRCLPSKILLSLSI
jgi:hypothetical protein